MDTTLPSSQQRPTQQPVAQAATIQDPPKDVEEKQSAGEPENKQLNPQHVSHPNKEFAPIVSASPSEQGGQIDENEEQIKTSSQEHIGAAVSPHKEVELPKELQEAGVEQGEDTPQEIPVVVQKAGMRDVDAESAVPVAAQIQIKMPISYAHAEQLDKQSSIKESIKWLAQVIKRQWERLNFFEKHKGEKLEEL